MCENVRFNKGEGKNNADLGKKMAALCDIFVMDASAPPTEPKLQPIASPNTPRRLCRPIIAKELDALGKALENPDRPLVAIVGGSKASTKLTVLESLSGIVDQLIVGGGIANTFIAAAGYPVGKSLYESRFKSDEAKRLMAQAKANGGEIPVPVDVVCAKEFSNP